MNQAVTKRYQEQEKTNLAEEAIAPAVLKHQEARRLWEEAKIRVEEGKKIKHKNMSFRNVISNQILSQEYFQLVHLFYFLNIR